MAYHYENLKLEKGMYGQSGRSFAQTLEALDPSENYKGTSLEGLDAFQRFVKRLPEGCELRVSNLEFQPLRTMARAGVQPIPGRLAFYPNREAALADL